MKGQSEDNNRRRGSPSCDPRLSGFLAGGLLFLFIVMGYLVFLRVQLALAKPRRDHLFQVFLVRSERVCGTTETRLDMFSLYQGEGSSDWRNYEYSGRIMLTDGRGGIGVDFLVQHNKGKEVFYRLSRVGETSEFTLRGHGLVVEYDENVDTRLRPKPWKWYRFRIRVEEEEGQTRIRGKIWEEYTPEPEKWKVEFLDKSPGRNARGSIGLEATGRGEKFFDDLLVRPIGLGEQGKAWAEIEMRGGEKEPGNAQRLLLKTDTAPWNGIPLFEENFEGYPVGAHPTGWPDLTDTMDLSDVADNLSRFFDMTIVDFAGPWDEVIDLGTMCLVFATAGFFAGAARKRRNRWRRAKATGRRASGILLEFLPFLLVFAYAGIPPKGALVIVYAAAAIFARWTWILLERAVAVIISPSR